MEIIVLHLIITLDNKSMQSQLQNLVNWTIPLIKKHNIVALLVILKSLVVFLKSVRYFFDLEKALYQGNQSSQFLSTENGYYMLWVKYSFDVSCSNFVSINPLENTKRQLLYNWLLTCTITNWVNVKINIFINTLSYYITINKSMLFY